MSEKVSILIPTYNRRELLVLCLRSAQLQTYKDLSILVHDDGSKDNTLEVLKLMQKKDDRIQIFHSEKNSGVAHARNELLSSCKTKYAAWLDSDDLSNIYRIEMQLKQIQKSNCAMVHSAWRSTNKVSQNEWKSKPEEISPERHRPSCFPTIMFDVSKAEQFNEKKVTGEDSNWKSRMATKHGLGVIMPQVLYYVRWHGNRLGSQKKIGKRCCG